LYCRVDFLNAAYYHSSDIHFIQEKVLAMPVKSDYGFIKK